MKKTIVIIVILAYVILFAANKVFEKTVGYDYDSTLAFSTPNFLQERIDDPSDRLAWELINGRLLSLEKRKRMWWTVPFFKALGYTPIVITARPEVRREVFCAHVTRTYGVKEEDIYMTKEKAQVLKARKTLLFFGDSDGDITEARKAGVPAVRVTRSEDDPYRENYHPGAYGEFILPFSSAHE